MKALIAPALLMLGTMTLFAQAAGEEKEKEVRGRKVWFVATHMPKDLENPLTVMVGENFHEVGISKRRASKAVALEDQQVVRVVRIIDNPVKPESPAISVLAETSIPASMRQALVILIPAKKEGEDTRFHIKVQDLTKFRGGDYLFLNLTPTKVAVQLGEKKLGIAPGQTTIYDASSIKKSTNATVQYHYFNESRNDWQLISASTVVLRPTRRELCIFSWNERYRRIDYHGITFPVER